MSLIPGKIFNLVGSGIKKSNLETIVDYLIAEPGAISLTDHQKAYLHRLEVVAELFDTGQYSVKQMAFIHAQRCKQSVVQSKRDIQEAEFAFGTTRKSNRLHKIHRHYDRLEALYIELLSEDKTELAIKVALVMTKALDLMPEDKVGRRAPTQIIMNILATDAGQITDTPLDEAQAYEIAMKKFELKGLVLEPENDDEDQGPEN